MARLVFGVATGSGQIDDGNEPVIVAEFHARSENAGSVYVGTSGATADNSREIPPGETFTLNFALPDLGRHAGQVPFNTFYAVISGGDKLDWTAILRDPTA